MNTLIVDAQQSSMWQDLMGLNMPVLEKVIRTIGIYLIILLILRFAGKRLMAQMNSFDLVVVLLLSNVVQNAIIGDDNTLLGGTIGAIVLVGGNGVIERLSARLPWLQRLLEGEETVVVDRGVVDQQALTKLGASNSELNHMLHAQGAQHVHEVHKATLAPGGQIVVELKKSEEPASIGDLRRELADLRHYLDQRLGPIAPATSGTTPAPPTSPQPPPNA